MEKSINRRQWIFASGCGLSLATADQLVRADSVATDNKWNIRYCFNTSTVRGQKLTLMQQLDVAAKAGYQGIEPWIRDIEAFVQGGGKIKDAAKKASDSGLAIESAIGFANWIVDDDDRRAKALEQAKKEMSLLKSLGGDRIAAPPAGATRGKLLDLSVIAKRYRALAEVGESVGVLPQLELWGFSKNIHLLGQLVYVATEASHPNTALLPDVYHIYKGGSDFEGLNFVNGRKMHCFHMNDYPADPPRDKIGDADRVYPGDGVAPLNSILNGLRSSGFTGALSLELFNPTYWKQDALEVAKTGLAKMKAAVAKSLDSA